MFFNGEICDIGSNSNGEYIKWANGIMICHKYLRLTGSEQNFNVAYGSVYYNGNSTTWTYPQNFISKPTVVGTAFFKGGLGGYGNASEPSTSQANGYIYYTTLYNFGTTDGRVGVDFIAIGKWK